MPESVDHGSSLVNPLEESPGRDGRWHILVAALLLLGVRKEANGQQGRDHRPGEEQRELVSRFDEPGHWMYHCHILEHGEGGMMSEIHVEWIRPTSAPRVVSASARHEKRAP